VAAVVTSEAPAYAQGSTQVYQQPAYSQPQQPYPPPTYPQQTYVSPGYYYYPSQAWPPEPLAPPRDAVGHRFSLTISLLHPVLFSLYEAEGEFRLGKHAGLAVIFGFGSIGLQQLDTSFPDDRASLWEGGGQIRFYPVGSFDHGMQLGLEFAYLHGSASTTGTISSGLAPSMDYTGTVTATGNAFKVGPFMGYKLTLPVGLTFGAQLGVELLSVNGLAKDSTGNSKSTSEKVAILLADANVGWSF
jgi:hypothetical protein